MKYEIVLFKKLKIQLFVTSPLLWISNLIPIKALKILKIAEILLSPGSLHPPTYLKIFITRKSPCHAPKVLRIYGSYFRWKVKSSQCVKSIRIRSFSCPYFPAFGLNTEIYSVFGEPTCQSFFFNKVGGLELHLYLKRDSGTCVFLRFLRKYEGHLLQNTTRELLPKVDILENSCFTEYQADCMMKIFEKHQRRSSILVKLQAYSKNTS